MSRVFRTEQPATRRRKLMQQMGVTLRHASEHSVSEKERRDMLAYLALCLSEISSSVDQTCQAWEKRDYWVKADRFRLEWAWAGQTYSDLSAQLEAGDLDAGAATAGRLGTHLGAISLPRRTRTDHPWSKAWGSWQESRGLGDDAGKT